MKIGIMGGTFNPVHNGHLMLGRCARDYFLLDEVWFMPNAYPPHKRGDLLKENTIHRTNMVEIAIANEPGFVLQKYELQQKSANYSYLTMEHFKKKYPAWEFYFIIGADSLFAIDTWKHPERLLKCCTFLVACRDKLTKGEIEKKISTLTQEYHADIRLIPVPDIDISSSMIRKKIFRGIPVNDMLPQGVCEYISKNNLYKDVGEYAFF